MSATRIHADGRRPCPVCEREKSCNWQSDGLGLLFCMGIGSDAPPAGWVDVKKGATDKHGFRHLKRDDGRETRPNHPGPVFNPPPVKKTKPAKAFTAAERGKPLTDAQRVELADHLGLPVAATLPVAFCWDGRAWTHPEVIGAGELCGIARRFPGGDKKQVAGGSRGLVVYDGWQDKSGPILVTEGMTDGLAVTHAGFAAVARANKDDGREHLPAFLRTVSADRVIVFVADNDEDGIKGANAVAASVAAETGLTVKVVLPPDGEKDIRAYLTRAAWGDTPWDERGRLLLVHIEATAEDVEPDTGAASDTAPSDMARARAAAPEYVPFPVDALPERVQAFVRAVAESTNTDPAFTALPLMSLLGAAVGTSRAVMPKRGWKVFLSFWCMSIGRSASGKSPPLAVLNDAVHPLVDDLDDENREALDRHHEAKACHLTDKSKKGLPPPPEPPAKRFRVGDTTIEALAVTLSNNARGVWKVEDELAGWFGSFTRYSGGKGNTDRPKWLSLFDGGFLEVDRKTGEPKHIGVRNTLVGVAGGIQPGILKAAMTEENLSSGLFARILVAYPPDRLTQWSDVEIPDFLVNDLTALLRALRWLEPTEIDGRRAPVLNTLHPDAKRLFIAFFNANRRHAFAADDAEAAATVKLEAYALRFAHLRHLCRHAGRDDSAPISAADMAAGIRLAEWFLNELHRVRTLLAEPERMQGQRRLVQHIREKGGSYTARDLQRGSGRRYPTTQDAEAALELLAADGFGEWADTKAANNKTVRRFVLHPEPLSDARHCPTLMDDDDGRASDGVSDAAKYPQPETLAGEGISASASDTVGRRTGSEDASGDTRPRQHPETSASDALPAEFYRSARPQPVFNPPPSAPVWPAMEWLQSRLAAGPCPQSVLVAEAESAGLSIISAALALQVDVYDADGVPTCRLLPNRPAAENTDFAFGHNSPGQLFDNGNGRVD